MADSGSWSDRTDFDSLMKNLLWSACALVRAGHADVWNYPWQVFVAAMDELAASLKR